MPPAAFWIGRRKASTTWITLSTSEPRDAVSKIMSLDHPVVLKMMVHASCSVIVGWELVTDTAT